MAQQGWTSIPNRMRLAQTVNLISERSSYAQMLRQRLGQHQNTQLQNAAPATGCYSAHPILDQAQMHGHQGLNMQDRQSLLQVSPQVPNTVPHNMFQPYNQYGQNAQFGWEGWQGGSHEQTRDWLINAAARPGVLQYNNTASNSNVGYNQQQDHVQFQPHSNMYNYVTQHNSPASLPFRSAAPMPSVTNTPVVRERRRLGLAAAPPGQTPREIPIISQEDLCTGFQLGSQAMFEAATQDDRPSVSVSIEPPAGGPGPRTLFHRTRTVHTHDFEQTAHGHKRRNITSPACARRSQAGTNSLGSYQTSAANALLSELHDFDGQTNEDPSLDVSQSVEIPAPSDLHRATSIQSLPNVLPDQRSHSGSLSELEFPVTPNRVVPATQDNVSMWQTGAQFPEVNNRAFCADANPYKDASSMSYEELEALMAQPQQTSFGDVPEQDQQPSVRSEYSQITDQLDPQQILLDTFAGQDQQLSIQPEHNPPSPVGSLFTPDQEKALEEMGVRPFDEPFGDYSEQADFELPFIQPIDKDRDFTELLSGDLFGNTSS